MEKVKQYVSRLIGGLVAGLAAWLANLCVGGACVVIPPETLEQLQAGAEGIIMAVAVMAYGLAHKLIDDVLDRKKEASDGGGG